MSEKRAIAVKKFKRQSNTKNLESFKWIQTNSNKLQNIEEQEIEVSEEESEE